MPFVCPCCGETRDESELSFGIEAPDYFQGLPQTIQDTSVLDDEQCIVGDEFFFVRGCLEIPIQGTKAFFGWSVWASLSTENFERMSALWTYPGREAEPPYFGWLSNGLPEYRDTLNLKCRLHTQPVGIRPQIELEPTDHPLAIDQRNGISPARAHELSAKLLAKTEQQIDSPPTDFNLRKWWNFLRFTLRP